MALTVDDIYQFTLNLIKKNQAGPIGSVVWARHWNNQQAAYMDDLLGRFQRMSNGKAGTNTGLIENETISQKLAPFTKKATIVVAAGDGNKPSGFIYKLGLRVNGADVRIIRHNQIATVNNNVIDAPSVTTNTYYAVSYEGYYTFLPNTVTESILDYIVAPTDVFWNYSVVSSRQVYNSVGSSQPQWDNNSCREITQRVLNTLGVSFKDGDFASFGNRVVNTGN